MNELGSAKNIAEAVREFVADVLFPRTCIGCGSSGSYLCDSCRKNAPRLHEHRCPFCESVVTPEGRTCLACAKRHSLDGVFAPVAFREARDVADAIHILKYEYVTELALPLGKTIAEAVRETELPLPDFIVPVPLHPWKLRYRGFNQSLLLSEPLAASLVPDLPVPIREDLLVRHRFTLPQARSRGAKERRENLRGAFSLDPRNPSVKRDLAGRTVWLVDDVATTGATLEECAKVLKKAGTGSVFGIVVAR
ncbi:MAG: ComF family protein [Candidatus Moranbacteria bacterium]|nr:ComF family protein [Candidatus Moranbacteria bacterium]